MITVLQTMTSYLCRVLVQTQVSPFGRLFYDSLAWLGSVKWQMEQNGRGLLAVLSWHFTEELRKNMKNFIISVSLVEIRTDHLPVWVKTATDAQTRSITRFSQIQFPGGSTNFTYSTVGPKHLPIYFNNVILITKYSAQSKFFIRECFRSSLGKSSWSSLENIIRQGKITVISHTRNH